MDMSYPLLADNRNILADSRKMCGILQRRVVYNRKVPDRCNKIGVSTFEWM
jgi:hypothetical protein